MPRTLLLLFCTCFFLTSRLAGQSDTTFLNTQFQPASRANATYFRIITFDSLRHLYKINDFYMNGGTRQGEAFSEKPDDQHLVGNATTFYFGKVDQIESVYEHKTYQTGWLSVFDTSGRRMAKYWIENNSLNGSATYYNQQGKPFAEGIFKQNRPFHGEIPMPGTGLSITPYNMITIREGKFLSRKRYYANGRLAMQAELDDEKALRSAIFYDPQGKKIGACTYLAKQPETGTHVHFVGGNEYYDNQAAMIRDITEYQDGQIRRKRTLDAKGKTMADCLYQNNKPFDGTVIDGLTLKTYQQGIPNGPSVTYADDLAQVRIRSNYVGGLLEGAVQLYDSSGALVASGVYKNDTPFSGRILISRELCDYENGKKSGACILLDPTGRPRQTTTWKDGKKDGEAVFMRPGATALKGIYRDGQPWDGDFISGRPDFVERYAAGIKTETITFFPGTDTIQKIEALKNGPVREFDRKGQLRWEGVVKNGAPLEGQIRSKNDVFSWKNGKKNGIATYFDDDGHKIRTDSFVDNQQEGVSIWYQNNREISRCRFEKGKPMDGTVQKDKDTFTTYKNGAQHGPSKRKYRSVYLYENWVDGKREGACLIIWRQVINGKVDTLRYEGTYRADVATDGYFVNNSSLEHRLNGRKNGQSITYRSDIGYGIEKAETFRNDTLDGPAVYYPMKDNYAKPDTLHCRYGNGLPVEGFFPDKYSSLELRFVGYRNGQLTGVKKVYHRSSHAYMEYRDGKIYTGRSRSRIPHTFDYYNEGAKTHAVTFVDVLLHDTLSITRYLDTLAITTDLQGNILQKTVYRNSYGITDGYTDYFNTKGVAVNRLYFEDQEIKSGCSGLLAYHKNSHLLYTAQVCMDSTEAVITTTYVNRVTHQVQHLKQPVTILYPVVLDEGALDELSRQKSRVECIETATGNKIAAYTIENEGKNGIEIQESSGQFVVLRYQNGHTHTDRVKVNSLQQAKEQVKQWEGK